MAELIRKEDTLNEGRVKLNAAIEDAETAKGLSEQADDKATQALANSESTQTQLDTIVIDGDSSVEAAQARVSADGTAYGTLKQRLDSEHASVTSQLVHTSANINEMFTNVKKPPVPLIGVQADGSDEWQIIQNLLDSELTGKNLFFPEGVYGLEPQTSYGLLNNGKNIIGVFGRTYFKLLEAQTDAEPNKRVMTVVKGNTSISNVFLDVDYKRVWNKFLDSDKNLLTQGLRISNSSNCVVEHVTVLNAGTTWDVLSSSSISFLLELRSDWDNYQDMSGNIFRNCDAIDLHGKTSFHFRFHTALREHFDTDKPILTNNKIENCYMIGGGKNAVELVGAFTIGNYVINTNLESPRGTGGFEVDFGGSENVFQNCKVKNYAGNDVFYAFHSRSEPFDVSEPEVFNLSQDNQFIDCELIIDEKLNLNFNNPNARVVGFVDIRSTGTQWINPKIRNISSNDILVNGYEAIQSGRSVHNISIINPDFRNINRFIHIRLGEYHNFTVKGGFANCRDIGIQTETVTHNLKIDGVQIDTPEHGIFMSKDEEFMITNTHIWGIQGNNACIVTPNNTDGFVTGNYLEGSGVRDKTLVLRGVNQKASNNYFKNSEIVEQ